MHVVLPKYKMMNIKATQIIPWTCHMCSRKLEPVEVAYAQSAIMNVYREGEKQ